MGVRTLADFRRRLNQALGDRLQGDEALDDWIQDANYEIPVLSDLEGMKVTGTASTVVDQAEYILPTNLFAILSMRDVTNDVRLKKMSWENYQLRDPDEKGDPEWYARRDRVFALYPTPIAVVTLRLHYEKEPDKLELVGDVTEFPAVYDRALHLVAMRNALLDLGDKERATLFHQSATNYLRSLPTEADLEANVPAGPMQVARDWADLEVSVD